MILTVKAPSRHKEHAIFTQQFFTDSPGIHRNVILQKTYRSFFGKLHMGALLCYQPLLYSFYVCLNNMTAAGQYFILMVKRYQAHGI